MRKIKLWYIVLLLTAGGLVFFYQGLLKGLLPIPSDALVGLYHPFRDLYAPTFPNGIPYKNFLLTDPIRQIIPWKELSLTLISNWQLPLWNPYEMTGKPLLGNFQSSPFYPLNAFMLVRPFEYGWTVFILSQQILSAVFMCIYLRVIKIPSWVAIFTGFVFAFSGFMVAWLEWGTVGHTFSYLPLILFSIEKMFQKSTQKKYTLILIFSLSLSLFAGHLQTFIYILALSLAYIALKLSKMEKKQIYKKTKHFLLAALAFMFITSIQWIPTLQFIFHSARDTDQGMQLQGWFIPPQHLIQFFAPDFFGNPSTLNYWGVFNYAEFFGYLGIFPLISALLTIGIKKRRVLFFQIVCLLSLIIAVDNPISQFLYSQNIPYLTSTQPTRLIGPASFSLIVLSAVGIDTVVKNKILKKSIVIFAGSAVFVALIHLMVYLNLFDISSSDIAVTKRNLILPALLLFATLGGILTLQFFHKNSLIKKAAILFLIAITVFEISRSAVKFTPFTPSEYFYPSTKTIEFLKKDNSIFRITTVDDRLLAPNISTWYRLQSIDGYDPLYLKSYAEYISASQRQEADISPPYGFNRIINPKNINSQLIDFMNVKYVVTLTEIDNDKFTQVFEEGETKIYENNNAFPRAFFVTKIVKKETKEEVAKELLESDLTTTAFTTEEIDKSNLATGEATIQKYSENEIVISTNTEDEGFLVLSDAYYPTWRVNINGEESTIYKVNLNFRGVLVPAGENRIVFYTKLF